MTLAPIAILTESIVKDKICPVTFAIVTTLTVTELRLIVNSWPVTLASGATSTSPSIKFNC